MHTFIEIVLHTSLASPINFYTAPFTPQTTNFIKIQPIRNNTLLQKDIYNWLRLYFQICKTSPQLNYCIKQSRILTKDQTRSSYAKLHIHTIKTSYASNV